MSLRDITNFTSHMSKKKQEKISRGISRRVTQREREREFRYNSLNGRSNKLLNVQYNSLTLNH